jgi:hypothetical protein
MWYPSDWCAYDKTGVMQTCQTRYSLDHDNLGSAVSKQRMTMLLLRRTKIGAQYPDVGFQERYITVNVFLDHDTTPLPAIIIHYSNIVSEKLSYKIIHHVYVS